MEKNVKKIRKNIDLSPDAVKTITKTAVDKGTTCKELMEKILETYAINKDIQNLVNHT